jgi:exosome complex exonuclease DIS3/RRP44
MAKRDVVFEKHVPLNDINAGLKSQKYFQGILRTRRNNSNEATITISSLKIERLKDFDSLLIKGMENINRAIDGDLVAFEIFPKENWKTYNEKFIERGKEDKAENEKEDVKEEDKIPTGKVVGILKRNWRCYCGSIEEGTDENAHRVFFIPIDRKIPKIRIQTRQTKDLMSKRITVIIDNWDQNSKFPDGHYMKTLGDIGDPKVESEIILLENEIPFYEFPQNVLDCLPKDDWYISEEIIKERRDFRNLNICSIDPEGCKDIDDALHVKKLKNGNYQVGVHIADVSYFVKEDTPLDIEALNRATSTYLVDRRIDMLPKILTENICSLRSNGNRNDF